MGGRRGPPWGDRRAVGWREACFYNGDPSLLEVLAYWTYFAAVGVARLRTRRARTPTAEGEVRA